MAIIIQKWVISCWSVVFLQINVKLHQARRTHCALCSSGASCYYSYIILDLCTCYRKCLLKQPGSPSFFYVLILVWSINKFKEKPVCLVFLKVASFVGLLPVLAVSCHISPNCLHVKLHCLLGLDVIAALVFLTVSLLLIALFNKWALSPLCLMFSYYSYLVITIFF